MRCLLCRNLEAAFETARADYVHAGSLASFGVSNRLAAYLNVEMERARSEWEEHRQVCLAAANRSMLPPATVPYSFEPRQQKSGSVQTAA
jgi:hypothetical protein